MTALGCISLFLYKNFYQIFTQSEEIIILRGEIISETINIRGFDEVVSKIKQKTIPRKVESLNDPFN